MAEGAGIGGGNRDGEVPAQPMGGWGKTAVDMWMRGCAAGGLGLGAEIANMPKPVVGGMSADVRTLIQFAASKVTGHDKYTSLFLLESNTGKALLANLGWGGYLTTKFHVPPPSASALAAHAKSFGKVSSPP